MTEQVNTETKPDPVVVQPVVDEPAAAPDSQVDELDEECEAAGPYIMKAGQYIEINDGKATRKLTNVTARITADRVVNKGARLERLLEIEAKLGEQTRNFTIKSSEFDGLGWVGRELGSQAIIEPGAKSLIPNAIRLFSGEIPQKYVANHTGWFDVEGRHVYIHAGGVIGNSTSDVVPDLPPQLSRYHLPPVPTEANLKRAFRESLNILDIGDRAVTVPVLAAVYRSVLGPIDMSLHLVGDTGTFKSTLAGLVLSHFGPSIDRNTLPAAWSGTVLSLQTVACLTKDALLVVDGFVPNEENAEAKAARIFRSQGNGSGRSRLVGGSLSQSNRDPRGLILSTGEAVPRGGSIRARLVIVPVDAESLDLRQLTAAAKISKQGRYAEAMSGYISWLAGHYEELQATLADSVDAKRQVFQTAGQHARASSNSAQLAVGMDWFLRFAEDTNCLNAFDVKRLQQETQAHLVASTELQSQYQPGNTGEVAKFINLLKIALHKRQAHLLSTDGNHLDNYHLWGWSRFGSHSYKQHGLQIGWAGGRDAHQQTTDNDIYLLPELAYQACQKAAPISESRLEVGPRTLWRLLHESGHLVTTDMQARNTRTIRKQYAGQRHEVLQLRKDSIYEPEADA